MAYVFGGFRLLPDQRLLIAGESPVKLAGRPFDLLRVLVERRDRTVTKDELMDLVWPKLVVEENNLQVQVVTLRRLLGHQAIATVPGRGYRFTVPVEVRGATEAPVEAMSRPMPGPATKQAVPGNLPGRAPSMFGRDDEVAELRSLVATHSLVTVAGAGGIGKTRLGLAMAFDSAADFPDGIWWVELAVLSDGALLPTTVAHALGIHAADDAEKMRSIAAFAKDKRLLLILDNGEHLIDAVAAFTGQLLAAVPQVRLLVTSQEVLRTPDEHVFRLGPLGLPAGDDTTAITRSGAGELFVARAMAIDRRFELNSNNAAAVAEICQRLDGIPLAIELAAARLPLLGIEGVRARLNERFNVLTAGTRVILRRHQTLRAALEWSHGLLTPAEQTVFRRLGVFVGGFTLEAAQSLADDDEIDSWEVLERLGALVDKSLVIAEGEPAPRYRLLETTRLYALERLADRDETASWVRRHADVMLHRLEVAYVARWDSPGDMSIPVELDNVRAALDWSRSEDGDRDLAVRLHAYSMPVWTITRLMSEGAQRCRGVVQWAGAAPEPVQAVFWLTLAYMGVFTQQLESYEAAKRAANFFRTLGDARRTFEALTTRAGIAARRSEHADAAAAIAEAETLARADWPPVRLAMLSFAAWLAASRDQRFEDGMRHAASQADLYRRAGLLGAEGIALGNLGATEIWVPGREAAGEARLRDAIERMQAFDNAKAAGHALYSLSVALVRRGAFDEAFERTRAALLLLRGENDQGEMTLGLLPMLAAGAGRFETAARAIGYAKTVDLRSAQVALRMRQEATRLTQQAMSVGRFDALVAEGAELDEEQVLSLVLDSDV